MDGRDRCLLDSRFDRSGYPYPAVRFYDARSYWSYYSYYYGRPDFGNQDTK